MIVFVDVNKKEIQLYSEKGLKRIPFQDANILNDIIGNQKIYYVTNAMQTTAFEITNLIRSITGQQLQAAPQQSSIPSNSVSNNKYLCAKVSGTVLVPDIDVKFHGRTDYKLLDAHMEDLVRQSPILQSLIRKGTIEVVGQSKIQELSKLRKQDRNEILKRQSLRDASLDAILVDDKVGHGAFDGVMPGGAPGDEAMVIELDVSENGVRKLSGGASRAGSESQGAQTMSELESLY